MLSQLKYSILILFISFSLTNISAQDSLRQLPIKGSSVFIEASDAEIKHFNKTANKQFQSWGYWNIVSDQQKANYILEIKVIVKGVSAISWGKVKIRGILKSVEGIPLWTSEDITGESNGLNGFNPKSKAISNLIKKGIEPKLNTLH